ncbi:penicillin-binding protein activator LpoB [Oceanisphaera avium]|uniref:Penicillin-binding protein activator LpoB n=1 Tax=Oceanisphaera avium TaxID=1903694 RepID=A0A1Y0CUV2_9GAMM|nr:penicillin-binding protein activator LpoB [Oceanisphaera avium]ART78998.1 penicillin-binding protein activator LpoB [Oceanisphaera avium]
MKPLRLTIMLASSLTLAACSMPNPYSSTPAPVKTTRPAPSKALPTPPPAPPVIDMPSAPPSPVEEVRSENLASLVDGLANKLKSSSAINEVQGPVLLNNISNQAGGPIDTNGLTARLQNNLQGKLNFADGAKVSRLREQLAYQGGRADMASLVRLGKQSGADYLLSTTLSRSGANLNLKGQLMELASGELLWSDSVSGR